MWEKNRLWVLQPKGAGCGGKPAARGNLLRGETGCEGLRLIPSASEYLT